jgi:hypothetical protein
MVIRELHCAAAMTQRFKWSELNLWTSDIPLNTTVVLGGQDNMIPAPQIMQLLTSKAAQARGVNVVYNPELGHGSFLLHPELQKEIAGSASVQTQKKKVDVLSSNDGNMPSTPLSDDLATAGPLEGRKGRWRRRHLSHTLASADEAEKKHGRCGRRDPAVTTAVLSDQLSGSDVNQSVPNKAGVDKRVGEPNRETSDVVRSDHRGQQKQRRLGARKCKQSVLLQDAASTMCMVVADEMLPTLEPLLMQVEVPRAGIKHVMSEHRLRHNSLRILGRNPLLMLRRVRLPGFAWRRCSSEQPSSASDHYSCTGCRTAFAS